MLSPRSGRRTNKIYNAANAYVCIRTLQLALVTIMLLLSSTVSYLNIHSYSILKDLFKWGSSCQKGDTFFPNALCSRNSDVLDVSRIANEVQSGRLANGDKCRSNNDWCSVSRGIHFVSGFSRRLIQIYERTHAFGKRKTTYASS